MYNVAGKITLRSRAAKNKGGYLTDFGGLRLLFGNMPRQRAFRVVVRGPQHNLRARISQVVFRVNRKNKVRRGARGWISVRDFGGHLVVVKS